METKGEIETTSITGLNDPINPTDATTKNYVDTQIASVAGSGGTFTGVTSGGGVVWTSGLNFTVSATTYSINGTSYSSPQTDFTLTAADATHDRIDVIVVNTSSAATYITGTPAGTPLQPTIDP